MMKAALLLPLLATLVAGAQPPAVPNTQASAVPTDFCARVAPWGPCAVDVCKSCQTFDPKNTSKCMRCRTTCAKKECKGNLTGCLSLPTFKACYQKCSQEKNFSMAAVPPPGGVCTQYASCAEQKACIAAMAKPPAAPRSRVGTAPTGFCARVAPWGPCAVDVCTSCQTFDPKNTSKCMRCRTTCAKKECKGNIAGCLSLPTFKACYQKCSQEKNFSLTEVPPPGGVCTQYASCAEQQACLGCQKMTTPGDVDLCMNCDKTCLQFHCPKGSPPNCKQGRTFKTCHTKCLQTPKVCTKYFTDPTFSVQNCAACVSSSPKQLDKCMACTKGCYQKFCREKNATDCKHFPSCKQACMMPKDQTPYTPVLI